jgi:hypothetical protein
MLLVTQHWFYVLVIPALAGLSWASPQVKAPSRIFGGAMLMTTALSVPAMWILLFVQPAPRCDGSGSVAAYQILGFSEEPWRWHLPTTIYESVFAPFALAELTIWHIGKPKC